MLSLSVEQVKKIFSIVNRKQFGEKSLIGSISFFQPERFLLFDMQQNAYFQRGNAIVHVGHCIKMNGKIFFIDQRNINQSFDITN